MLEDDFTYIIRKALRALELAPAEAAANAGLDGTAIMHLLAGHWDEATARALAPTLGLGEDALAAHPTYQPPPCDHPAITRIDLPFGQEQVNAWLIDVGDGKLLIDAGCDTSSLQAAIEKSTSMDNIRHVIITHNHGDHTGGLKLFDERPITLHGPGAGQPWIELRPGDSLDLGKLHLHIHDLSGHAVPAIGLQIHSLGAPVLATGDALFAGSIGGCAGRAAYQLARTTLGETLRSLPPDTLLLPGHGPPTRLDSEWLANPFLTTMHIP